MHTASAPMDGSRYPHLDGHPVGREHGRLEIGNRLERMGINVTRYGLVVVLMWIGAMKFTAYEAEGIMPLVVNSPFMSWLYGILSIR